MSIVNVDKGKISEKFLQDQNEVFQMIASGITLNKTLEFLCQSVESTLGNDVYCSIFLANDNGDTLIQSIGPSLPKDYIERVTPTKIGPNQGSCGAAAYYKRIIVVKNIEESVLWKKAKGLALKFGFKACWSTPVFSSSGGILGTFALYFKDERTTQNDEYQTLKDYGHLAGIATELSRLSKEESEQSHSHAIIINIEGKIKYLSDSLKESTGTNSVHSIYSLIDEHDIVKLKETIQGVRERKSSITSFIKFKLGKTLTIANIDMSPVLNQNGEIEQIVMGINHLYIPPKVNVIKSKIKESPLLKEIKNAYNEEQFTLYYQPKVSLKTPSKSAEALIRWNHPSKGVLLPGTFIPEIEKTDFINTIDRWVLSSICKDIKSFNKSDSNQRFSLNLSPSFFQNPNLIEDVKEIVKTHEVDPTKLEFEITERMIMKDIEMSSDIIKDLKKLGIRIAMDDFGSYHSSLNYLKSLPVDSLKIDRTFIKDVADNPTDRKIVEMIISLAHNLNLEVVAEGVETEAQLKILKDLNCDVVQGFYFSKPMPSEKLFGEKAPFISKKF